MSSKDEEKSNEVEIEFPQIQEVEHKTPHPKPEITREQPDRYSSDENPQLRTED